MGLAVTCPIFRPEQFLTKPPKKQTKTNKTTQNCFELGGLFLHANLGGCCWLSLFSRLQNLVLDQMVAHLFPSKLLCAENPRAKRCTCGRALEVFCIEQIACSERDFWFSFTIGVRLLFNVQTPPSEEFIHVLRVRARLAEPAKRGPASPRVE